MGLETKRRNQKIFDDFHIFQENLEMNYIFRNIEEKVQAVLGRGKSILLLGPRQTGKTTLLSKISPDLSITLLETRARLRYEKDPQILADEVGALNAECPLVIVDEIQKVPELMDIIQWLIDQKKAQFILTGSSARKLKRHSDSINLLPGRVVLLNLDPLSLSEYPKVPDLKTQLYFGSLPGIYLQKNEHDKAEDLASYVRSYLEEEVRAEALVRNMSAFGRFLELAASESGKILNISKLSNEIGVSIHFIQNYFQILEDCLILKRVDPITRGKTRKKLTKSPRYLFFDLGVRRVAANEGLQQPDTVLGDLFEQWVGIELLKQKNSIHAQAAFQLHFWRDPGGPEVDWVIQRDQDFIPIEVKWTDRPSRRDARHLETFMDEYPSSHGYIVCTSPRRQKIGQRITAIPWQELGTIM